MCCPNNAGTQCTANDLYSYYTPGGTGRARTDAYYQAFDAAASGSLIISPIIDGRTDSNGYPQGFNELSPQLAAGFADTVAGQVCADPHVDGIQFDIEPFNVSTKNGQYFFYLRLAKDFAGQHLGDRAADPFGCIDAAHPRGRFFSVFTFAVSIQPGTESASNVQDVLNTYGNGYFMDSLYDLSSAPRRNAQRNHRLPGRRKRSGHQHEGMGQPATHQVRVRRRRLRTQFTTCAATPSAVGGCVPDAAGATGYPVIDYAKAAVIAIDGTGALHDPRTSARPSGTSAITCPGTGSTSARCRRRPTYSTTSRPTSRAPRTPDSHDHHGRKCGRPLREGGLIARW